MIITPKRLQEIFERNNYKDVIVYQGKIRLNKELAKALGSILSEYCVVSADAEDNWTATYNDSDLLELTNIIRLALNSYRTTGKFINSFGDKESGRKLSFKNPLDILLVLYLTLMTLSIGYIVVQVIISLSKGILWLTDILFQILEGVVLVL